MHHRTTRKHDHQTGEGVSERETVGSQPRGIRTGTSRQTDPTAAAAELASQLQPETGGLSVVFCSPSYNADDIAAALGASLGAAPLIGCTTAGEIGPDGYQEGSLVGVHFAASELSFEVGLLENVSALEGRQMAAFALDLRARLRARHPMLQIEDCFALMLVDGLCTHEESIVRAFHDGLGRIPLSGGSAGDGLRFTDTRVIHHNRAIGDAAVLLIAHPRRPVTVFKTQHFSATDSRLIVTRAVPEKRMVLEINGCPAADEYARTLGIEVDALTPEVFAAHPLVVRIGGADFVRSILSANPDRSLTFYCAIDRGIVLKIARGDDLAGNLRASLERTQAEIGPPALILGCDCVLRQLECHRTGVSDEVGRLLKKNRVIGFNTFGEQYRGMHINQTFTGIAFGEDTPR